MNSLTVREARAMVSCLQTEKAYTTMAADFVPTSIALPDTTFAMTIKSAVCYDVFHTTENILKGDEDPVRPFIRVLKDNTKLLESAAFGSKAFTDLHRPKYESVEEDTGSHYGNLFNEFDDDHYFNEALKLLRTRLERNGFDFEFPKGKRALDAGCGGGRYTVALKRLGFKEVVGLDYSKEGIAFAKDRLKASNMEGISFRCGTVLDLPFSDESFDFVFSNGVLHHTADMVKGIRELLRVLKVGGQGFLYLIESPGGIFWDVIEILRPMLKTVPYEFARGLFRLMGVPPNRRYYILDHIMVPINIRVRPKEVEEMLKEAGAVDLERLKRGADFDRVEQIYRNVPYHAVKFGVGENRYFFRKA